MRWFKSTGGLHGFCIYWTAILCKLDEHPWFLVSQGVPEPIPLDTDGWLYASTHVTFTTRLLSRTNGPEFIDEKWGPEKQEVMNKLMKQESHKWLNRFAQVWLPTSQRQVALFRHVGGPCPQWEEWICIRWPIPLLSHSVPYAVSNELSTPCWGRPWHLSASSPLIPKVDSTQLSSSSLG